MRCFLAILFLGCLSSVALNGQTVGPDGRIKSYSSYEDYCADNPNAPTCSNGKPLKYDPKNNPLLRQIESSCRNFPNSTECKDWCAKNPDSCKGQPSGNSQQQSANTRQAQQKYADGRASRSRTGPSIIEIQTQPTEAQMAAVKTLGLHADWRFADPHAETLMGVDAAAVRQSPTLRAVLAQVAPALKMTPDDVETALAQTGDIDQLWLSMHAKEPVLVLQGRHLIAPAGPTNMSNGMVIYGLARGVVLLGHPAPAAAAVQRLRSVSAVSAAALQMKAQGAESDVWVTGTRAALSEAKVPLTNLTGDLSGYVLGVSLRDGVKAELKLNYATAAAARHALTEIRGTPLPPEWPVHLSSEMVGTSVRLKVAVAQAEIAKALDKALVAPAAKPVLEMIAHSVQRSGEVMIYGSDAPRAIHATPNTTPAPGKLVIYGLPGGPKVM